jgi:hypothetical protein
MLVLGGLTLRTFLATPAYEAPFTHGRVARGVRHCESLVRHAGWRADRETGYCSARNTAASSTSSGVSRFISRVLTCSHTGQGEAGGTASADCCASQKGRTCGRGTKAQTQGEAEGGSQAAPSGGANRQTCGTSGREGSSGALNHHRDVSPSAPDCSACAGHANRAVRNSGATDGGRSTSGCGS